MSSIVGVIVNTTTMTIDRIVYPSQDTGIAHEILKVNEQLMTIPASVFATFQSQDDAATYLGLTLSNAPSQGS